MTLYGPLDSVAALDLTNCIFGPCATQTLGDPGAIPFTGKSVASP